MATEAARRSRPPALLALGQVRYQLMLLLRSRSPRWLGRSRHGP